MSSLSLHYSRRRCGRCGFVAVGTSGGFDRRWRVSGVTAGNSSLIGTYDYSDTFTGTTAGGSNPNRPFVAALQPPAAYAVENTYTNPSQNFQSQGQAAGVAAFSFASDTEGRVLPEAPPYPGSSGAGSATGFTQSGSSVDYGILYGLRREYIVQVDAVQSGDRVDITTGPTPGTIGGGDSSLSVFIRGTNGTISLYDGVDTVVPIETVNTGISTPGVWHNYAVKFDQDDLTVEVFVDEQSKGVVDLVTFAGGRYADFSNAAVGAGIGLAGGESRAWTDNFQVGAPVPEPTMAGLAGAALFGLLSRRRRR